VDRQKKRVTATTKNVNLLTKRHRLARKKENERRACERERGVEETVESEQTAIWLTVGADICSHSPTITNEPAGKKIKKIFFFDSQGLPGTMTPKKCFSGVIILFLYLTSSNNAQRFEGKAKFEATISAEGRETNICWHSRLSSRNICRNHKLIVF